MGFIGKIFIIIILMFSTNLLISRKKAYNTLKKLDFKKQFKIVDGIKVSYIKKGSGEPLVLIPGFMNCIYIFKDIIGVLSKSYTVYAVDLAGFGYSDKSKSIDYSREGMASMVLKFMNSIGVHKFNVLGHSLGGEIVINMAYISPKNIKKAIIVDSTGYEKSDRLLYMLKRFKIIFDFLVRNIVKSYFVQKIFFKRCFYGAQRNNEELFLSLFSLSTKVPAQVLYKLLLCDENGKAAKKNKYIKVPTLIIWGKQDKIIPIESGRYFRRDLSNSKLVIIDKCGHVPFIEKREKFLRVVKEYLG